MANIIGIRWSSELILWGSCGHFELTVQIEPVECTLEKFKIFDNLALIQPLSLHAHEQGIVECSSFSLSDTHVFLGYRVYADKIHDIISATKFSKRFHSVT